MSENNGTYIKKEVESVPEFNLREFIFKYQRYIPYLIVGVVMALVIAFINIRYSTPIYKVSGTLFINKENRNSSKGESFEQMFVFSDNVNLKNELEILRSRPLLSRVVKNLGLQVSYYNRGKVRTTNVYGSTPIYLVIQSIKDSLAPFSISVEANENGFHISNTNVKIDYGQTFETANGVFQLVRMPSQGFQNFNSNVFVIVYKPTEYEANELSGAIAVTQTNDAATILNISMETENPKFGKVVINELMREYGRMNVEDKREISRITTHFIDERLDSIRRELSGVESGLLQYREKNEVIDLDAQSKLYYDNLSESDKQLSAQEVQLSIVDLLINYLNDPKKQFDPVPADLGIKEPVLAPLITEFNTLQLQHSNLVKSTGPSNPMVLTAESSINKLRQQIIEALNNVRQSYEIAAVKLRDNVKQSESNIRTVPSKAKGLLEIERQQKIKQDLYLFLLQKREEAAISGAATVSSSKVLEDALGSSVPVKPNKKSIYLIALFLGLLIPLGIAALIEMMSDKVSERDEIVKQTDTPIVGEIGHADGETLAVKSGLRTLIAEQFRIVRTNAQYLMAKADKPVILITSSISGEGKSFVATNFGAVMALTGKKTVIMEFDIRKPKLLQGLHIQSSKGLTNFIVGNAKLDEVIHPVPEVSNLYVIGSGPIPPNPSELLLDEQVGVLFSELKKRFDIIVIDTAPLGLVSDAFTLSKYCDTVFYIIRQGYTRKKQLKMVEDLYRQKRLPNMGLIVNDIKIRGRYKGYYGYGGYGYYGYGYAQAEKSDYFEGNHSKRKKLFPLKKK